MQQNRDSPFDEREVERPKRKRKDRSGEQYEKESKKPRKSKHHSKPDDLLSPTSSDHLKKRKHRKRRKHEKGHKEKMLSSDINNETPAASTQEDNHIEMSTSEIANEIPAEIPAEASSSLDTGKVQSQQTNDILEDATSQEAIDIPYQENNGTKKEVSIVPDNLQDPTDEVPKTDEVLSQEEIASRGNSKSREVSPKPHPLINSLHNDSGHKKHKHKHSKSKERRRVKESEPLPIIASMVSRVEKSRHKKHKHLKQERHHHHDDKLKRKKSKKCSKA